MKAKTALVAALLTLVGCPGGVSPHSAPESSRKTAESAPRTQADASDTTPAAARRASASEPAPPADAAAPVAPQEQAKQQGQGRLGALAGALATPSEPEAAERKTQLVARPTEVLAPTYVLPSFCFRTAELGAWVDPDSGEVTLFEQDRAGALALRRARTSGRARAGLFGAGWRSDLESRVVPYANGYVVERLQGLSFFLPLPGVEGAFASARGEAEVLRRTKEGFSLVSETGRVFRFDARGRLSVLLPDFVVAHHDDRLELEGPFGRATLRIDPKTGRATRLEQGAAAIDYRYDHDGELVALSGAATRAYRARNDRLLEVRGAEAGLLDLAYDARGRVARLAGGGQVQSYRFDAEEDRTLRASVTRGEGTYTARFLPDGLALRTPRGDERVWLDGRGRIVALADPEGGRRELQRDRLGRLRPRADDPFPERAGATELQREYDEQGRLVAVRGGDDYREELRWDEQGRPRAQTGPDGRTTRFVYQDERTTHLVSPAGTTALAHDEAGRLTDVRTPAGRAWSARYDAAGRQVAADGPMGPVTYRHDEGGRLVGTTDASGRALRVRYDGFGRPVELSAGAQVLRSLEYDEGGRPRSRTSPTGALTWGYDPRGLVREARWTPRGGKALTLRYGYGDRLLSVEGPFGARRTRYDAELRPASLETEAGTFAWRYDERGLAALRYPNGVELRYTRDAFGRALRTHAEGAEGERLLDLRVRYDERHQVVARGRDGRTLHFAYDEDGRLAEVRAAKQTVRYAYDEDGNRVSRQGESSLTYRYDERGRLLRAGEEACEHDAAGRLTRRGETRYAYDALGRLERVERQGAPAVRYAYDPLGRLSARSEGEARTRYLYEGDRLLAELGPGGRERVYVYGPDLDQPLAYREGGRWTFLLTDDLHHGLCYLDERGQVVDRAELDPWGEAVAAPGADRPLFFAGRLVDRAAGLVNLRARWYDPSLGRFLTPDPSQLRGGVNAYAYVRSRPLDRIDPLGLWDVVPDWARSAGSWIADTASDVASTAVDVGEALGMLVGVAGTPEQQADIRQFMWEDIAEGRAQSRALGCIDSYVDFLSFGLVDPNLSRWAYDQEEVKEGRKYGEAAGWTFAVLSMRPTNLLKSGWRTLRAAPGAIARAPGSLANWGRNAWNGLRASRGGGPGMWERVGNAAREAVAAAREEGAYLWNNRGPLARALRDRVGAGLGQAAADVWRWTGEPFVNLGKALTGGARDLARTLGVAGRGSRAAGAAQATTDAVEVARGSTQASNAAAQGGNAATQGGNAATQGGNAATQGGNAATQGGNAATQGGSLAQGGPRGGPPQIGIEDALRGEQGTAGGVWSKTNDISDVAESGRFWGSTEGRAYGAGSRDARRWQTMIDPKERDPGFVHFVDDAAELFERHPVEGPYSAMKRVLGQYRSVAPGDVVFTDYAWNPATRVLTVRGATLGDYAGQSVFSAASRELGRQTLDGGLTLFPFTFRELTSADGPGQ
ncbi:MAG: RHS repeat-associated core domain-containing protein [Planctomycetota bacterium]